MPDQAEVRATFRLEEATIEDLHAAIKAGEITCVQVVQHYIARARAFNGVSAAIIEISQHTDGKVMSVMSHLETPQGRPPGNQVNYALLGLLAGLSTALGFLVPPGSRVTAGPV